ncbi:hypothetical protein QUA43_26435 [Microcoleus sp. N9_B4]|uniref:hypothetical protein n=1 Tax=Microcoleus sp. N9_B4 TaxID=3055386 RepID=UPI002FD6AA95
MSASNLKVKFIEYNQPPLDSGEYKITVEQTIKTKTSGKIAEEKFSQVLDFVVSGHRFAPLTKNDIYAVFPPSGNLGEYSNALPHITLKRSTLPWERSVNTNDSDLPWVALLLFRESEKPTPQTIKLKDLTGSAAKFPGFTKEAGQTDEDELTVIDVPKKLLAQILPTQKEVALLAHINELTDANDKPLSEALATVLGNRLPQPGEASTVHLVALENRYKGAKGQEGEFDYQGAGDNDLIRLVSLTSWSFTCVNNQHNFTALLKKLDRNPDTLRLPELPEKPENNEANNYLKQGYVPLPHALRQGDKTISWYHSPLSSGQSPDKLSEPVPMADALVRYDSTSGLFDVSYAAAWELGRMLTLQNQRLAVELFNWKRANAQNLNQLQLQVLHLPFQGEANDSNVNLPEAIANWFADLELLKGIPFNYLVPDERLLPPESLRFFWVDSYWVDCLQDGAFSMGRVTSSDLKTDTTTRSGTSEIKADELITGLLLHSEVVSGWPGLEIEGYSSSIKDKSVANPQHKLTILRRERLSDNILLCLFKGEVKTVDLSLKSQSVNCGVDPIDKVKAPETVKITKGLRKLNGEQGNESIDVSCKSQFGGVIDIKALAGNLAKLNNKKEEEFTSAQFALSMIEGSQKIRFCM